MHQGSLHFTAPWISILRSVFCVALLTSPFLAGCKKSDSEINPTKMETTSTTVISNDLKLRIAPNTTAAEITRLSKGEALRILQKSSEPSQVGSFNAHWYKVTTSNGLSGWVYGAHLAIEADTSETKAQEDKNTKRLQEMMLGRFEAAKTTGALTAYFVTLTSDGQIEMGYNRKATHYGKYKFEMHDEYADVMVTEMEKSMKPLVTDIRAKLVMETIVYTCKIAGAEYRLNLVEKNPELFRDEEKKAQKAAASKP